METKYLDGKNLTKVSYLNTNKISFSLHFNFINTPLKVTAGQFGDLTERLQYIQPFTSCEFLCTRIQSITSSCFIKPDGVTAPCLSPRSCHTGWMTKSLMFTTRAEGRRWLIDCSAPDVLTDCFDDFLKQNSQIIWLQLFKIRRSAAFLCLEWFHKWGILTGLFFQRY